MRDNNKTLIFIISGSLLSVLFIFISVIIALNFKGKPESETSSSATSSESYDISEPGAEVDNSSDVIPLEDSFSPKYINLDGLYFLPSAQYDFFESEFNDYLISVEKTDVEDVFIFGKVETEDDNFYTFWLILNSTEVIRGMYSYSLNRYSFIPETEGEIFEAYQENYHPDGIDPYKS